MSQAGPLILIEVDWENYERDMRRVSLLEPIPDVESRVDSVRHARFAPPHMLLRTLLIEKLRGDITNLFYSMGTTNTEFYPHQFKPVLSFIESTTGRLLIADEVGLGKTIEAMLIWKELQARASARRLLVVCPAMLREKWRRDMTHLFGMDARIALPSEVLDRLQAAANDETVGYSLIAGIEGLRGPRRDVSDDTDDIKMNIARLLEQHPQTHNSALLDLVVFDEAHYLRNPETANHALAERMGEAAQYLLLLTATPIQLHSDNLFRLLRLVDPERFPSADEFDWLLRNNEPIVEALRALWRPDGAPLALAAIRDARGRELFASDPLLAQVEQMLSEGKSLTPDERIRAARIVEGRSLTSHVMSRSRKREVLPDRVIRNPHPIPVHFSKAEAEVYNWVTELIRKRIRGAGVVARFSLITRQRQMASSIPAALAQFNESTAMREILYEDLGIDLANDETFADSPAPIQLDPPPVDMGQLEAVDSKYGAFRTALRARLGANPSEKIVVFSFFRGTVVYLERRLKADGISAVSIMGGQGTDRDAAVDTFREPHGPSVLLSTEVGAEGIDLQFCRTLVNYDLPWNPMRVEQRIGRLDRLGQTANQIHIVNLWLVDTIEERILDRLYDRVEVFKRSIGDLEDILGTHISFDGPIERLISELFQDELTDEQREQRALQSIDALANQRDITRRLEEEAINLAGFTDYILDTIRDSHEAGRWIRPVDLRDFVIDFLHERYPGSRIERDREDQQCDLMSLSYDAKNQLQDFIEHMRPTRPTRLDASQPSAVRVTFEPRWQGPSRKRPEVIDITHPLVGWIRAELRNQPLDLGATPVVEIAERDANVGAGTYVCAIDRWSFRGWRNEISLRYCAVRTETDEQIGSSVAERLVNVAIKSGKAPRDLGALNRRAPDLAGALNAAQQELAREFAEDSVLFETENESRCDQQEQTARRRAERRLAMLHERRERLVRSPDARSRRILPALDGQIRLTEEDRNRRLDRIAKRRIAAPSASEVAAAIIVVTEADLNGTDVQ